MEDDTTTFRLPEMTAPLGSFSTVTFGGSNGGANAAALPLYWPDRFHAAGAMVYPPSLRRELGEHAFWEMTKGMSGFDESGIAYLLDDAHDAAMIAQANAPGVIPVGVFYGDVSTNPGDEVLVAGMFGEVAVFGFAGGALLNQPLQVLRLEGCVGLHGSIRKDGSSIILAGSQGTWRLDPQ